jgi:hypothetical protein
MSWMPRELALSGDIGIRWADFLPASLAGEQYSTFREIG